VGVPAAPAPATAAAPSFGHDSGASVQSAALTARLPFGMRASCPPFASTHSPIQRSDSARRFARVAICLFANAATRTPVASAPFRSTCARTAARTSRLYPTNVIASSSSYVAYTPATGASDARASSHALALTMPSPSSRALWMAYTSAGSTSVADADARARPRRGRIAAAEGRAAGAPRARERSAKPEDTAAKSATEHEVVARNDMFVDG
jgi:hypothetical protein